MPNTVKFEKYRKMFAKEYGKKKALPITYAFFNKHGWKHTK